MTKPNKESRFDICTSSDMAIGSGLKNFKIPCLNKLDRLIRLHPDLEIDSIGPILPNKSAGREKRGPNNGNRKKDTKKTRNHNDLARRDKDEIDNRLNGRSGASSSGVGCDFDAIFYEKESTKAPKARNKARPSSRSSVVSLASKSSFCVASSSSRATKSTKPKRDNDGPTQSSSSTTTRASIVRGGKRNKQLKEKRPIYPDIIDTNHVVDETIVIFLPEFCQKANITDIPDDPLKLCEKFTIPVPHLDLSASETPPHDKDDEMLSSWKARASESIN